MTELQSGCSSKHEWKKLSVYEEEKREGSPLPVPLLNCFRILFLGSVTETPNFVHRSKPRIVLSNETNKKGERKKELRTIQQEVMVLTLNRGGHKRKRKSAGCRLTSFCQRAFLA